jgi:hypothetical protein
MDTLAAKYSSEAVRSLLARQKVVDLDMTLSDLINKVSTGGETVGYWVIAFDRYALVVEDVAQQVSLDAKRRKLAIVNSAAFNLNIKLRDLSELAFDSKLDQVGFNIVAWDKVVLLTHLPSQEERMLVG